MTKRQIEILKILRDDPDAVLYDTFYRLGSGEEVVISIQTGDTLIRSGLVKNDGYGFSISNNGRAFLIKHTKSVIGISIKEASRE